jgi:hypothetical protein
MLSLLTSVRVGLVRGAQCSLAYAPEPFAS